MPRLLEARSEGLFITRLLATSYSPYELDCPASNSKVNLGPLSEALSLDPHMQHLCLPYARLDATVTT